MNRRALGRNGVAFIVRPKTGQGTKSTIDAEASVGQPSVAEGSHCRIHQLVCMPGLSRFLAIDRE